MRDYRRWWVFSFCAGSKLARDIAGGAVLALLASGIPPRVATILHPSAIVTFNEFPVWAQVAVLAAYTGQLGAETWGGPRDRFMAGAVSLCAAMASAALFWLADPWGGAFWQWAGHAAVQLSVIFVLARQIGYRNHAP